MRVERSQLSSTQLNLTQPRSIQLKYVQFPRELIAHGAHRHCSLGFIPEPLRVRRVVRLVHEQTIPPLTTRKVTRVTRGGGLWILSLTDRV